MGHPEDPAVNRTEFSEKRKEGYNFQSFPRGWERIGGFLIFLLLTLPMGCLIICASLEREGFCRDDSQKQHDGNVHVHEHAHDDARPEFAACCQRLKSFKS